MIAGQFKFAIVTAPLLDQFCKRVSKCLDVFNQNLIKAISRIDVRFCPDSKSRKGVELDAEASGGRP